MAPFPQKRPRAQHSTEEQSCSSPSFSASSTTISPFDVPFSALPDGSTSHSVCALLKFFLPLLGKSLPAVQHREIVFQNSS